MTAVDRPAFSAFEKQLKTLCLKEFPCGSGTWRETDRKKSKLYREGNASKQFSVTLKDYGANYEKTEVLDEFVNSSFSPWHLDYSWSEEAKELRQLSVRSPWLIDDKFVFDYFKTLRIVDKDVTEVDPNLLRFSNLKELTLSANLLSTVNSRNLPPSLEVLELCANQICDLSSLCVHPPKSLHHLGLGFNKIQFIGDYITGDYWPSLLSLDLSSNNLTDLLDVVRKMSSLPKLRNLVLQGNPLSLIAGYRGYTIDSLRKITVLDDIMISADEKHHYKGLARRREYILDEAKITLEVSYVKGIPVPEEMKNVEDQPEYPIVERRYFIQFMFLEDSGGKGDVLQLTHGDMEYSVDNESDRNQHCVESSSESGAPVPSIGGSGHLHPDKNVNFTEQLQIRKQSLQSEAFEQQEKPITPNRERRGSFEETDDYGNPKVSLCEINSEKLAWAEEIEMNWSQVVTRDDLLSFRNFIKQGMEFSVIEQVVLCYPPEEQEVAPSPSSSRKGKDDKGKDKKKDDKKDQKGGKDDKKKKKKEAELELKRMPPTYTTLATFQAPLEDFLEGEYIFESIFTKGNVEIASTIKSCDTDHSKKDGGKKPKEDKKKPASGKKKEQGKEKDKKPAQDKKGKDDKKDAKGKGKSAPAEEEESTSPPPPLEVKIGVRLHHWRTALDSLKEEEEKLKNMQEQQQS